MAVKRIKRDYVTWEECAYLREVKVCALPFGSVVGDDGDQSPQHRSNEGSDSRGKRHLFCDGVYGCQSV